MKNYSKRFLHTLLKMMIRIRRCEESLVEPILRDEVKCPVHLYSGEEAIAVGVCECLERTNYVFGNHRSHGHYLAKGGAVGPLIAEIFGKKTGCSRGRGGSMHVIDPEIGMMGSAPIVGGTISLALGAALAAKIRKDQRVSVSAVSPAPWSAPSRLRASAGEGALDTKVRPVPADNRPIRVRGLLELVIRIQNGKVPEKHSAEVHPGSVSTELCDLGGVFQ